MKKNTAPYFVLCLEIMFTATLVLSLNGCATNQDQDESAQIKDQQFKSQSHIPGIYPDTIRVFDILGQAPKSTWKDLDHYYKVDIPIYHSGKDYTDNLKKLVIFHLVITFDLINNADKQTLEYYVHEQSALPIPNADILVKCLAGLKGYWPDARIKSTALAEYNRLIAYVKSDMKHPEEVLAKHKIKFDKLKDFGEHILTSDDRK